MLNVITYHKRIAKFAFHAISSGGKVPRGLVQRECGQVEVE